MEKIYRDIVSKKEGATANELKTKVTEGTVEIESVTITNFDSYTARIVIGILGFADGSNVDPAYHPVGEPLNDVVANQSRCLNCKFYLEKGERVYAKFDGIGKKFSILELNVQGKYLSKT
ncbi:MAG: hypothetical protein WCP70_08325 [Methanothrix sp.]